MVKTSVYLIMAVCVAASLPAQTLAQDRGAAELSLNRGIEAFMSEKYTEARRHFEDAVARDPEFAAAHYFLGLTLLQAAPQARTESAKTAMLQRALEEFEQSRLRDPQLVLAYLDIGIAQLLLGRFQEAESGYKQYMRERPDDPLPYLFTAVLYYRQAKEDPSYLPKATENLDQAEDALQRSGRIDRSLEAHIRLYRALIHLEQDDREAARQELAEGYELAPDTKVGRESKELLDRIDWGLATARRPWELTVQYGYDWDTNVILRGENIRRLPGEDQEDGRFGLASAFTFRLVDTEDVVFGVGTTSFNSWHSDIDEFDVQTYGANIYGAYSPPEAGWFTLGLRYDWDYSFVGRDSFLTRHRVTPQVDIQEADWTSTTLFYQLDVREYFNQPANRRLDRDGLTHAFGVIQSFELFEMFDRPFTADISYRYENTRTDGSEFESTNHIFALGVTVPLPEDFTFQFVNEWELARYKNPSIFDRDFSKRRDVLYSFVLALTKRFDEHLSARFEIDIFNDDSNVVDRRGQQFFSFDRVIYGLSIVYIF